VSDFILCGGLREQFHVWFRFALYGFYRRLFNVFGFSAFVLGVAVLKKLPILAKFLGVGLLFLALLCVLLAFFGLIPNEFVRLSPKSFCLTLLFGFSA
jgi:hypothetical protein